MVFRATRNTIRWLVAVAVALTAVGGLLATAQAQQPRLYVSPSPTRIDLGGAVIVEVRVADIANLYGCHIELRYDPTKAGVRDNRVSTGDAFASKPNFVIPLGADPSAGVIAFAATLINPEPPIEGSAVLFSFVLEGAAEGSFNLTFQKDELVSRAGQKITTATDGAAVTVAAAAGTPTDVTVTVGPTYTPVPVVVDDTIVTPTPVPTVPPGATVTPAPTSAATPTATPVASPTAPAGAASPTATAATGATPFAPTATATAAAAATPVPTTTPTPTDIAAGPAAPRTEPSGAAPATPAAETNWILIAGIALLGGGGVLVAALAWTGLRRR